MIFAGLALHFFTCARGILLFPACFPPTYLHLSRYKHVPEESHIFKDLSPEEDLDVDSTTAYSVQLSPGIIVAWTCRAIRAAVDVDE